MTDKTAALDRFKQLNHKRDLAAYAVVGAARVVRDGIAPPEALREYLDRYDAAADEVQRADQALRGCADPVLAQQPEDNPLPGNFERVLDASYPPERFLIDAMVSLVDTRTDGTTGQMTPSDVDAWYALHDIVSCILHETTEDCVKCGKMQGQHAHVDEWCPDPAGGFSRTKRFCSFADSYKRALGEFSDPNARQAWLAGN